jgi:hypothetical protein
MAASLPDYKRLHITPFTPSLLTTILAPSILPSARNISYHTLETLPERAYGFVELPAMEADKLKMKLNGSILKGKKIKIEAARPSKRPAPEMPEPEPPKREKERGKKRKRDDTIKAAEIGERSVKRGWTVPSEGKGKKEGMKEKKMKSKYTNGKECLFKTIVPSNKVELKEGKRKKDKNGKGREEVVHEFERTMKHASFLRGPKTDQKKKGVSEFVEGKGWIDEDGEVIEEVTKKQKKIAKVPKEVAPVEETSKTAEPADDDTSDDITSDSSSSEAGSTPAPAELSLQPSLPIKTVSLTSSSGSSSASSSDSESESDVESAKEPATPLQAPISPTILTSPRKPGSRPASSSGLTIKIPEPVSATTSATIHPLEALYKRPAASSSEAATKPAVPSFSFFGNEDNAQGDGEGEAIEQRDQLLLTPFTQREFEFRGLRSAAPTPDTAHGNKRFVWPTDNVASDEEDDEEVSPAPTSNAKDKGKGRAVDTGIDGKGEDGKGKAEESEFQKWFWENRGETNRAWKKRRKVVSKEKRQRENRKRGERA